MQGWGTVHRIVSDIAGVCGGQQGADAGRHACICLTALHASEQSGPSCFYNAWPNKWLRAETSAIRPSSWTANARGAPLWRRRLPATCCQPSTAMATSSCLQAGDSAACTSGGCRRVHEQPSPHRTQGQCRWHGIRCYMLGAGKLHCDGDGTGAWAMSCCLMTCMSSPVCA